MMATTAEVNAVTAGLQQLHLKQKGVFCLGEHVEGWVDKTKAAKEEIKRQSEANETFFVKNAKTIELASFQDSAVDVYTFNMIGMTGAALINLLRHVIVTYRDKESWPFYFKFAHDKKFKVELMPTPQQPGNGLVKVVGRLKYYSYPDMCAILTKSGVTSKGLGQMTFKLNTEGMKSAMHNVISPINELHFMLLFEVARRLVRDEDGQPVGTEPALDQLPVGVVVGRIIHMLLTDDELLDYNKVFGSRGEFNCFSDPINAILRRKQILALNKLYFEEIVQPEKAEDGVLRQFLEENKAGYVIKTVQGYLNELRNNFGEV